MYKKCISIVFDFTRLLLCTRNAYRSSLTSLDFYYVQQMHIDRPSLTSLDFIMYKKCISIVFDFTRLSLCKRNAYRSSLTSLDFYYVKEMHIDRCISIVFDFTRLSLCTRNAYRSSLTSLDFYYVQEMHIDRL